MSASKRSTRENPVWLLWVIWGITFAFIAFVIFMWFWFQRPIKFEERDVYGTWSNGGPNATSLEFKRGGIAVVSGAPLPHRPEDENSPIYGRVEWQFTQIPAAQTTWVWIGKDRGEHLYAENDWLSTSLVLYVGDIDDPKSRIKFVRVGGTG